LSAISVGALDSGVIFGIASDCAMCSPKLGRLNAITTWPLIGWNATSSASATIVSPSEHTRSLVAGLASAGSVFLSASRFLRTFCSGSPAASRSFADFTATRSQNV
jgi:hypothetical protein